MLLLWMFPQACHQGLIFKICSEYHNNKHFSSLDKDETVEAGFVQAAVDAVHVT